MRLIDVDRGDLRGWTRHRLEVPDEVFGWEEKKRAAWIAERLPPGFNAFIWLPASLAPLGGKAP